MALAAPYQISERSDANFVMNDSERYWLEGSNFLVFGNNGSFIHIAVMLVRPKMMHLLI